MLRKFLLAILIALVPLSAMAQSVTQSGSVTAGHLPAWVAPGIIQDAGPASGSTTPRVTELGVTKQGGNAICVNSDVTTAAGRVQLCLGASTNGPATIYLQNLGTATPQVLNFLINGQTYAFPFTVGGITGPVSSVVGDIVTWNNTAGSLVADSGRTLPAGTIVGTTDSQTLTNKVLTSPTINTPTITGATISGSNVCSHTFVAKSSTYSPVVADAGSMFSVTNRSTIGFSSTPNFYPSGYCVDIFNAGSVAVIVTVPGTGCASSCFLWPGQTERVVSLNGNLVYSGPHRYAVKSLTVYVGPGGSCNDNNDGLTANAAGQICHVNTAIGLIQSSLDSLQTNPIIQLADGNYTEAVTISGQGPWAGDGIIINGNNSVVTNVSFSASNSGPAFSARDYGILFLQNMEINCSGSFGAVLSSQFSTIDVGPNILSGSCTGQYVFQALDGGHVDFNGGYTLQGNAAGVFYAIGTGSEIIIQSQTVTCGGAANWVMSVAFAESVNLGMINAPGLTFSNCAGIVGSRYLAASNSVINTNAGGATYFPGNAGGTTQTGGIYE